jgi:hypothetical protein
LREIVLGEAMRLHLLNTCIIPWFNGDCTVSVTEVSASDARTMLRTHELVSHVGHDGTAKFLTNFSGVEVSVDRSPWNGSGAALVCQLHGRQAPGVELTVEQMLEIGVGFRLIQIDRR